jgi:hypothetical protein
MFTPDRIAIEKLDGTVVAQRYAPRDSFAGHQMHTPWDPLHRAYFNGEAVWTYLTTPFLLAMDGVRLEETEVWHEGTETWRVLRAYFPGWMETHLCVPKTLNPAIVVMKCGQDSVRTYGTGSLNRPRIRRIFV